MPEQQAQQRGRRRTLYGNFVAGALQEYGFETLESDNDPYAIKKTIRVAFSIRPATGLEPYLGARAHLIAIHQDAITFLHAHADESLPLDGRFEFLARFPQAGVYQAWIQFIREGRLITRQFSLEARESLVAKHP